MIQASIQALSEILSSVPDILMSINEKEFSAQPSPEKWSKKQILGHLIDSATNNHQRFIRSQAENNPQIYYDQEIWVKNNYYQQMHAFQIIEFWTIYNYHILHIIKNMTEENYLRTCTMKDGQVLSIAYLVNDYIQHMQHHLKQILPASAFENHP